MSICLQCPEGAYYWGASEPDSDAFVPNRHAFEPNWLEWACSPLRRAPSLCNACHALLQGGDWEAALERYNVQKEQTAGMPLSPTGLSRQGTRKIGVLGRTSTINPLTRQATMNLNSAGGKRAQAVEGLKQQVEDLKAKLQVCCAMRCASYQCAAGFAVN